MPLASTRSSPSSGPVCGRGNSRSSIWRGPTCTAARTMSAIRSILVDDNAADVLAVLQVLVGLVDLVEAVAAGDQLVELEVPGAGEAQQPGDVVEGVAVPEQGAADLALVADQHASRDVHRMLVDVADGGDRDLAALAGHRRGGVHHLLGDPRGRQDRVVGELAPGRLDD